jgi:hypothetical protein
MDIHCPGPSPQALTVNFIPVLFNALLKLLRIAQEHAMHGAKIPVEKTYLILPCKNVQQQGSFGMLP